MLVAYLPSASQPAQTNLRLLAEPLHTAPFAMQYFALDNYPSGEARRALERLYAKRAKDRSQRF